MTSAPIRTVAPAATPVSLSEVKAHLRVTSTAEDTLIGTYIDAAVAHLDAWAGTLGRCMVTQTWRQDRADFADVMDLPFPDAQSVTVAYYDGDNVLQTLTSTNYALVNAPGRAWVERAADGQYPDTYDRPDAVQITGVFGYGAASAVPAALKAAILLHVGVMFMGRAEGDLPAAHAALVAPYRVVGL